MSGLIVTMSRPGASGGEDTPLLGKLQDRSVNDITDSSSPLLNQVSKLGFNSIKYIGSGTTGCITVVKKTKTEKLYVLKNITPLGKYCKTSGKYGEVTAVSLQDYSNLFSKIHGFITCNSLSEKWNFVERLELKNSKDEFIVGILTEHIPGAMDLYDFRKVNRLTTKQVQIIGKQIGSALKVMHEHGFIHRDIKPSNILIYKNEKVKLIDFDASRYLDDGRANTQCGTADYMAPEVISQGSDGYGIKADAWSFGMVLYDMAFNSLPPFVDSVDIYQTMQDTVKFAESGKTIEEEAQLRGDPAFVDLLNKLICHEDNRITVAQALEEPFFKQALEEPASQSSILKFLSRLCCSSC